MGGFELFDHTADLGVEGRGDSLGEALAWTATGMFSVIADLDAVKPREELRLSVAAVDEAETALEARCVGEQADPERHRLRPAVKAATYHGLQVEKDCEWRIRVVLDI